VIELTKNLQITLSYKEFASRYDIELRDFLQEFKQTRKIPLDRLKQIDDSLQNNISYFRHGGPKTLERINKKHFHGYEKGVPVIVTNTFKCKEYSLFHNQLFMVDEFDLINEVVVLHLRDELSQITVNMLHFQKYFELAYCTTIYSVQGLTLSRDYNILDVEYYSFNMLYTALSRAKHLSQIHIGDFPQDKIFRVETPLCVCAYLEFPQESVNSVCYQILYKEKVIYIGITQQADPQHRWLQHLSTQTDKHYTPLKEFINSNNSDLNCFEFKITDKLTICNRSILLQFEKDLILTHITQNPAHELLNQQNIKKVSNKRKLDEIVIDVQMSNILLRDRKLPTAMLCAKKKKILVKFYKNDASSTKSEKKIGFLKFGFHKA
jgi:hypothetical protein